MFFKNRPFQDIRKVKSELFFARFNDQRPIQRKYLTYNEKDKHFIEACVSVWEIFKYTLSPVKMIQGTFLQESQSKKSQKPKRIQYLTT